MMGSHNIFSSIGSILFCCFLTLFTTVLHAQRHTAPKTFYVDYRSPLLKPGGPSRTYPGDGLSWQKAFPDLQIALQRAEPGDTIRIAQGTYKPSAMLDLSEADPSVAFKIPAGVTLTGGYAGVLERNPDKRDIRTFVTILSGDLLENDVPFTHPSQRHGAADRQDNTHHVVIIEAPSEENRPSLITELNGLTISGGHADSALLPFGGGMVLDYAKSDSSTTVTIKQCTFTDNFATIGGAFYGVHKGELTFDKCSFMGNASSLRGGAIYLNHNLRTTITTCQFSGNWTRLTGGAISFDNGTMSQTDIDHCSFSENIAETQPRLPDTTLSGQPRSAPNVHASLFWNSNYPLVSEELIQEKKFGRYIDTGFNHIEAYYIESYFEFPPYVDPAGDDSLFGTLDDNLQLRPDSLFIDRSLPAHFSEFFTPNRRPGRYFDTGFNHIETYQIESFPLPADPNVDMAGNPRIRGPQIDSGAFEFQYQLYVDDDSTVADGIGTFDKPYPTIQAALSHAKPDYQVILLPGTYQATGHSESAMLSLHESTLHITSIAPHDPEIIATTIIEGTIRLRGSAETHHRLTGFTLKVGPHGGIFGSGSPVTLSHCMIVGNQTCDGTVLSDLNGLIQNCLIADNRSTNQCGLEPVIRQCRGTLRNCTITGNSSGVFWKHGTIENCIIYDNGETPPFEIINSGRPIGPVTISYSNIQGGQTSLPMTNIVWGEGNLDLPPRFIQAGLWQANTYIPGDYRLKSRGWQWNQSLGDWDFDPFITSPCIDAGNPESDLADEPLSVPSDPMNAYGINHHINMGFYGGTSQASLAPPKN